MSKLIVVCGLPGVGKTTLAKRLAKELNIGCLHKDSIKERLYEIEKCKTLEDSKRLGVVSIKLLFFLIEEFFNNNVDLIVEAPFSFDDDPDYFKEVIKKYNLDFYCVICSVDQKIRKKRFVERERHIAHHDIERLANNNDKNLALVKNFDFNKMPNNKIWINTINSVDEAIKEVIDKIN